MNEDSQVKEPQTLRVVEFIPWLDEDVVFTWDKCYTVTASFVGSKEILGEVCLDEKTYTAFFDLIQETVIDAHAHPILNGGTVEQTF